MAAADQFKPHSTQHRDADDMFKYTVAHTGVYKRKQHNQDEKNNSNPQRHLHRPKRHSSTKRRSHRRRQYGSSPHLELRLQLLNGSDGEQGDQVQAGGAGHSDFNLQQDCRAGMQQAPVTEHGRQACMQQRPNRKQQQLEQPVAVSAFMQDWVPGSPCGTTSPDSACAVSPSAQHTSRDKDEVVPGTPDEQLLDEFDNCSPLLQEQQQQQHLDNEAVVKGQRQQQQRQEFAFPESAAKQVQVTPTLGTRFSSRVDAAADAPALRQQFGAVQAAVEEAAATGLAGHSSNAQQQQPYQQQLQQQAQLRQQLGSAQEQQQRLVVGAAAFSTPVSAAVGSIVGGRIKEAAAADGIVSGVNFIGRTPSSASTNKGLISPSDDGLCAMLDSFEKKYATRSCAGVAAAAAPQQTALAAATVEAQAPSTRITAAEAPVAPTQPASTIPAAAPTPGPGKSSLVDAMLGPMTVQKVKPAATLVQPEPAAVPAAQPAVFKPREAASRAAGKQSAVPPSSPVLSIIDVKVRESVSYVDKASYVQQWLQQQDTPVASHRELMQPAAIDLQLQQQQKQQRIDTTQGNVIPHNQLQLNTVPQPPYHAVQQQQQRVLKPEGAAPCATAATSIAAPAGHEPASALLRDSAMELLPVQSTVSPTTALQLLQQQQPGVSPTNASDTSAASGSKTAGSLTPGTLAALEMVEQAYAQQQHAVNATVPGGGNGAGCGLVVTHHHASAAAAARTGQPQQAAPGGELAPEPAASIAAHGDKRQAAQQPQLQQNVQHDTLRAQHQQQMQLGPQKVDGMRLIQQRQQHTVQQQEATEGLVDSPTAKRRRHLEQQVWRQQQNSGVNSIASNVMPEESPLPAKVLFQSATLPGSSGHKPPLPPQHQQVQQQVKGYSLSGVVHSWQQDNQGRPLWPQQQQWYRPPLQQTNMLGSSHMTAPHSAVAQQVQPVTLFGDDTAVNLQQFVEQKADTAHPDVIPDSSERQPLGDTSDRPSRTQQLQDAGACTAVVPGQAGAVVEHISAADEESSSDSDEDDLGGGYGIFSQAAAVACMIRVSQRLNQQYRASQLKQLQQHREEEEAQRAALDSDSDSDEEQPPNQHQGSQDGPLAEPTGVQGAEGSPPAVDALLVNAVDAGEGLAARNEAGTAAAGADVPGPESEVDRELTSLSSYLPGPLVEVYKKLGLTKDMYPWQAECLNWPGVLDGKNIVYCAPTSGGKSLVAEIVMLRRLLTTGRPALLVMPYVSLCAQKAAHLAKLLGPLGKEVKSLYGGLGGAALTATTGVIVCTIEKANSLVNKMLEDDTLGQISCVVVDELHMVGDDDRGYLLELMLTKLRYATQAAKDEENRRRALYQEQLTRQREEAQKRRQQEARSSQNPEQGIQQQEQQQDEHGTPVGTCPQPSAGSTPDMCGSSNQLQIIGMSATLPNVHQVAEWLDAELYQTTFRPIELQEYVKIGLEVRNKQGQKVRDLAVPPGWDTKTDNDLVALLANEVVQAGHSVLIFCCSKAWCEIMAKNIAKLLNVPERIIAKATQPTTPGDDGKSARDVFVRELARYKGVHAGEYVLKDVISKGVAFHHAGLTSDEREIVEKAYRSGAISVLCATSTLAAGVNLPARRVIFKHAYVGRQDNYIDTTKYRQMSGRAGRAGLDTEGESFLIANQGNCAKLVELMNADSVPVASCLIESRRGMKRAMLEVVAAGVVASSPDVERYLKCSLLAAMENYMEVAAPSTLEALKWLSKKGFLTWEGSNSDGSYCATELGKATAAAGLDPNMALLVKNDLEKARMGLCLASDLHLTYLVTPFHQNDLPDLQQAQWQQLMDTVQRSQSGPTSRVIEYIGLDKQYVLQRSRGLGPRGGVTVDEKEKEKERIAKRFYAALVLTELISGDYEAREVAKNFKLTQGQVEGLQEKAGSFAHTIVNFCERHGWHDMEALFSKYQSRLCHGVRAELVVLTEIPFVKGARAKLLYRAGLRTPEAVAASDVHRILEILLSAKPKGGKDQDIKAEKRAAKGILQGAKDLVAQQARTLAEQQEALLAAAALVPAAATQGTIGPGSAHGSLALPMSPSSAGRLRAGLQQQREMQQSQQKSQQQQVLSLQAPPQQRLQLLPPDKQQQRQQEVLLLQPPQQPSADQAQMQHHDQQQLQHASSPQLPPPSAQQQQLPWVQQQHGRAAEAGQQNQGMLLAHSRSQQQQQAAVQQHHWQAWQDHPTQRQQQQAVNVQQGASYPWQHKQPDTQQGAFQNQQQKASAPWQPQQAVTAHTGRQWQGEQQQQYGVQQQQFNQQLAQQQHQPQWMEQRLPAQQQQHNQQHWQLNQQQQQPLLGQQPHQQQQPYRKRPSPEPENQPDAKRYAHAADSEPAVAGSRGSDAAAGGVVRHDMPPPSRRQPPQQLQQQQQSAVSGGGTLPSLAASAPGSVQPQQQQQQHVSDGSTSGGNSRGSSGQHKGIVIVKDQKGMQQLIDTLSACKCWAFSVAYDHDQAPPSAPLNAPGKLDNMALPIPPCKRSASGSSKQGSGSGMSMGVGSGRDAATAGSGGAADTAAVDDIEEPGGQLEGPTWSWSVLGVAFSTGDSCAYYVPLTRRLTGSTAAVSDPADADTVRVGTGARVQQLWEGLRYIFTHNPADAKAGSSKPSVAAAGAAINNAVAAMRADAKASRRTTAAYIGTPEAAAAKVWLSSAPVRITYALKMQLAMLASPPAASGLKGFVIAEPVIDVRLAGWTLDPDMKVTQEDKYAPTAPGGPIRKGNITKGLEELLKKYGNHGQKGTDVIEAAGGLPRTGAGRHIHACKRACMALKLHGFLKNCLQVECVLPVLMGLEMPMVRLLACMEARGIAVQLSVLQEQQQPMRKRIAQLEEEAAKLHAAAHQQYGHGPCHLNNGGRCKDSGVFNLASPADVSKVLFGCLRLPPPPCAENKQKPNSKLSTKDEVLLELLDQHEMPGIIRQHRKLSKLLAGFIATLQQQVQKSAQQSAPDAAAAAGANSALLAAGGGPGSALLAGGPDSGCSTAGEAAHGLVRIRGAFLQTNTSTGRLSMEDPSFQTIPRPVEFELTATQAFQQASQAGAGTPDAVAAAVGALTQQVNKQLSNIRAAFVAPPGSVLMSADYCQIELRLMAHFSKDEDLLAALRDPKQDPFVEMASTWHKIRKAQVTGEQRNHAKRIAYGLLYGMGAAALGTELGISMGAAKELMDDFQNSHPKLDAWLKDIVEGCKANGWITTIAGRRRHLPHIRAEGKGASHQRAQAERQAINSVHQGSAADIVKYAMLQLVAELEQQGLMQHGRLLLQVHDELLFEVSTSHLAEVAAVVRNAMEQAAAVWSLSVPLPVKLSVGPSWGQLEPYA